MPRDAVEQARALMLELHPEGFEEVDRVEGVELAAYTGKEGERHLRQAFGCVRVDHVVEGWEDRWRSFHRGVCIGSIWIGPPWEAPPPGALVVVVDPGRAFGTGAHPTTRLSLELLCAVPPGSLLDVGCGSGVIAVAGAKLGFAPVFALDLDPEAVEAARRTGAANGVDLSVRQADALREDLPEVETAAANIALDAVTALAPRLRARRLISSGYLSAERPDLSHFRHRRRLELDGWAADEWDRGS